jgi:hypothetical protein
MVIRISGNRLRNFPSPLSPVFFHYALLKFNSHTCVRVFVPPYVICFNDVPIPVAARPKA